MRTVKADAAGIAHAVEKDWLIIFSGLHSVNLTEAGRPVMHQATAFRTWASESVIAFESTTDDGAYAIPPLARLKERSCKTCCVGKEDLDVTKPHCNLKGDQPRNGVERGGMRCAEVHQSIGQPCGADKPA